ARRAEIVPARRHRDLGHAFVPGQVANAQTNFHGSIGARAPGALAGRRRLHIAQRDPIAAPGRPEFEIEVGGVEVFFVDLPLYGDHAFPRRPRPQGQDWFARVDVDLELRP